jgi:hypothetical protein
VDEPFYIEKFARQRIPNHTIVPRSVTPLPTPSLVSVPA